jgi:RecG-like helicase
MDSFSKADSEISILVATTVVEVGVDVPESSICVIDRAENFGTYMVIANVHFFNVHPYPYEMLIPFN